MTIADSERKVVPLRDEFDPQLMRKRMLEKGIEFLESHNFMLGLLTWQSELNKGADLPNVGDINRYFGSWAVFNSVVRNTYRDPGFEFNPKESELKGYEPTQLPARELNMRPRPAPSVLERKAETGTEEKPKPIPVLASKGKKTPAANALPEQRPSITILPPIEEFVAPVEAVRPTAEPEVSVADLEEVAGNADPEMKAFLVDESHRPRYSIGIGSIAAVLMMGLSFKGDSVDKYPVAETTPRKPVSIESPAPMIKPDLMKQLGVIAADDALANYKNAEKKVIGTPKVDSPPEKVPDDPQWTPLVYRNVVDIVRTSRPKSILPEYNLSPDAKDIISVQGVINTAFYEGTRLYSDDEDMHWTGGLNTVAQRLLAERWLAEYAGADLEELSWHREEEFDESFIDADTADLAIVPGYVGKEKKVAPVPVQAPKDDGNQDRIDGVKSYRKKAESDSKDNKLPTTGHLQIMDSGRKDLKDPVDFDIDESPAYESYTPEQRETIATLYAEMRFGKEFDADEMCIMGNIHSIRGLTADIAEDIYFEQKSGVSMHENKIAESGSTPLDYLMFDLKAA